MTGYASAQQSPSQAGEGRGPLAVRLGIEIRSVNSRFLDLAFRLPDELRAWEPQLRELLTARLKRGKVEVRVSLESSDGDSVREPSVRMLQRLSSVQDAVRGWLPDAQALSVAEILRLGAAEAGGDIDWGTSLTELAQRVLTELLAAREREGERLAGMLLAHLAQLRALAQQARPLVPQLVEQQRQRFLERWKEAMHLAEGSATPEAAQDRALTEATAFAIRIDVAEELTRLAAHLDEIERLIRKGGDIGKRLDFLIQELHREANTLGSKSAALELTRISVDMKVLIEQMREQVQNLE
ncbi:YicC/YloC family endoribonuclease [Ramlibacter sp.]|uniref:YicC/YloC family endoribonuclease n=1 Tax=Ramlibacter sp. TaxID=1917967 RepID=UPI0039C95476